MHDLADACPPGGFGQSDGADNVHRRIELRIGHRMPDIDLGRQVEDHLGPVLVEDRLQIGGDDIGFDEEEIRLIGQMLEVGGPPRGEIVQTDDGVSVGEQAVDQRRSDEPGSSGDQCAHQPTIPRV